MSGKKIKQLVVLNSAVVVINIILFSKIFVGLSLVHGSAFMVALGWTEVFVSACAFVYGNLRIMRRAETRSLTKGINNLNDCVRVLEESRWIKTFAGKINENKEQIGRFGKKQMAIKDILLQKFNSDELTYRHFVGVLQEVESTVYLNVRSILNKIAAFDEDDYNQLIRKNKDPQRMITDQAGDDLTSEKMQIYNEYISFVNRATQDNEQILLKLDKMLLEISSYNSLEDGAVENMPVMKELDELIKNAKLYR